MSKEVIKKKTKAEIREEKNRQEQLDNIDRVSIELKKVEEGIAYLIKAQEMNQQKFKTLDETLLDQQNRMNKL
jgi:hypothetical protein